jgi:quercetin dioxygenase-like cupin family protein
MMRQIPEWPDVKPDEFQTRILPRGQPAVLRGLALEWPLVVAARESDDRWLGTLIIHASNLPVDVIRAEPSEEGRFHYSPDGQSLNFVRGQANLALFLGALREHAKSGQPHALAVQGLRADQHLPGFRARHPMPLVPVGTEPRIWIGNASKVATHNDPVDNIAVVVAGRRRFTLFPPESEQDLYLGPSHPTPAGTPVSMVHMTAPDLKLYPRFASALEAGEEAELAPGDAIFIPKDWFHHVEALEPFNMLVNYWWDAGRGTQLSRSATE